MYVNNNLVLNENELNENENNENIRNEMDAFLENTNNPATDFWMMSADLDHKILVDESESDTSALAKWKHAAKVLRKLQNLRHVPGSCDLVLIADDEVRVSVDRKVLSACSDYFNMRFYGQMASKESEFRLYGISGSNLQLLVEFCYTGVLQLDDNNVQEILLTASILLMETAVEACSTFLKESFDPMNCLQIISRF